MSAGSGRYVVHRHFTRWAVSDVADDRTVSTWDTEEQANEACARMNKRDDHTTLRRSR